MSMIERARVLRAVIERMAAELTEGEAAENIELFPEWVPEGKTYAIGDRVRYSKTLYKVLQTHTSQPDWTPDEASSLYAEILPGQDGTDIGVWEQPDSTNGYMTGDRVHFPTMEDPVYESTIDNNIWSPADYPQGWRLVE